MDIIKKTLNILFPQVCPICGDVVNDGEVHGKCEFAFSKSSKNICIKCGKSLGSPEEIICSDCMDKETSYDISIGAFEYNDRLRKALYEFKYNDRRDLSKEFAKRLLPECKRIIKLGYADVITNVPASRQRIKRRGYDQAALLARDLAGLVRISYVPLLKRVRDTLPMKDLSKKDRMLNMKNAFKADLSYNSYKHKRILVIDDIYTTGATLDACAKELKRNGAKKVYGLSMCIGKGV